jgi:hypothetical protein
MYSKPEGETALQLRPYKTSTPDSSPKQTGVNSSPLGATSRKNSAIANPNLSREAPGWGKAPAHMSKYSKVDIDARFAKGKMSAYERACALQGHNSN